MTGVSVGVSGRWNLRATDALKNLRLTSNPARGAIHRRSETSADFQRAFRVRTDSSQDTVTIGLLTSVANVVRPPAHDAPEAMIIDSLTHHSVRTSMRRGLVSARFGMLTVRTPSFSDASIFSVSNSSLSANRRW